MTKRIIIGVFTLGLLTVSCQKQIEPIAIQKGKATITATIEQTPQTKATVDINGIFNWATGDNISIWTKNDDDTVSNDKFTNGSGAGKTCEFNGSPTTSTYAKYAVYPYSTSHQLSGEDLTINLPNEYGTIGEVLSNNINTPMVATIGDDVTTFTNSTLTFKHVGALIRVAVEDVPEDTQSFVFEADKDITGDFSLETSGVINAKTKSTNNVVTIKFKKLESKSNIVFYVPVPVGEYSDYTIKLKDDNGNDLLTTAYAGKGGGNLEKGQMAKIDLKYEGSELKKVAGTYTVSSNEEVVSLFNRIKAVNPIINVTAGPEVTVWNLPANYTAIGTTASELTIEYTEAPASLSIQATNAGEASGASQGNIRVVIPTESADVDMTGKLDIKTPTLTINLAEKGSNKLNYNEADITSATSTVILENGVSITTLNAQGGNIQVESGASVGTLNIKAENTNVDVQGAVGTIVAEDNCTVNVADGVTVGAIQLSGVNVETVRVTGEGTVTNISAASGVSENAVVVVSEDINVTNKDEDATVVTPFEYAIAQGGEVTLEKDVLLSYPLIIKNNVIIDLNGHSIKSEGDNLSAAPGTNPEKANQALFYVLRNGNLTLKGEGEVGVKDKANIYAAVIMTRVDDTDTDPSHKAVLTVDGPTLSGYYYAISGNGSRHGTEINIKSGTLASNQGSCIYHPQEGVLTINGGTLVATDSAIEMRAGTLNITNGTFQSTASVQNEEANFNGTTISGAAIAVSQHATDKDLSVNISGGTFNGYYALYEKDFNTKAGNRVDNISLNVTGGTFNGKVYSQNCKNFIKNGTFSDLSAVNYVADNGTAVVDLKGVAVNSDKLVIAGTRKNITIKSTGTKATITFPEHSESNTAIQMTCNNSNISFENVVLTGGSEYGISVYERLPDNTYNSSIKDNTINLINTDLIFTDESGPVGITLIYEHTLNLTNSTITHGYFGITQNGTHAGSTITVNGGTISGPLSGIYLSNKEGGSFNSLTVNGASISSQYESPIEVKKTNISVTNCTLTSEADVQKYVFSAGGSGAEGYGVALVAYEEGRLYEGTVNEDIETNNTFNLTAGEEAVKVFRYAGKEITTAAELKEYLSKLVDADSGDSAINITQDITITDGDNWEPLHIDGYSGAGTLTINGNNHFIAGLKKPLLQSGFAGNAGLVVKDLTIKDSQISGNGGDERVAVFFGECDSMPLIEFDNCHISNVSVNSTNYAAGFVAWNSGYNGDGPVETKVSIKNCTITNSTFVAGGSVGGFVGHAGANPNTINEITDCSITNCQFTAPSHSKVGYAIGTVNVGKSNTISNITSSSNTVKVGESEPVALTNIVGRFVPGTTGYLVIDGDVKTAFSSTSQQ